MKFIILLLFLLYILYLNITVKAVKTVTALTFSYTEKKYFYISLQNAFNEYSKNYGLDINLDITVLTPENSTALIIDYSTTMDDLLTRKATKYDIYFYYGSYSYKYSKHLVDLNEYISEKDLKNISDQVLLSGMYDGILAGLPVTIDISTLYSNQILLNKYKKQIPKTWDELIDTARFILQKEKEENPDSDLIGYNGQANDESAMVAIYEFIQSFRDSNASKHPPINSQTTIDAIEKLKYLKDQISSNSIFRSPDDYTIQKLYNGGAIFLKFWYLDHNPIYTTSALPGAKAGVSGSIGLANSLGICKYIGEDKIKAAAEVVKFIISEETQKNHVIKSHSMSAIPSLYDDEEVCNEVDCGIIKAAMPLSSMIFTRDGFGSDDFVLKYRRYMFDFLYGNKTSAAETVNSIYRIIAIHNFSINTDEYKSGLIIYILVMITIPIILCSTFLLFINQLSQHYSFLPRNFWFISIFGIIMIMSAIFTLYNDVTKLKCHFRLGLLFGGYYIFITPILCKLIMNIPHTNTYTTWVKDHSYLFIFLMLLVEIIINLSRLLVPLYKIEKVIIPDGKNFEKCVYEKGFGPVIYYFEAVWIALILLVMLFLTFIEWNLKDTVKDVRLITASVTITILSFIMHTIINRINIENYIAYNAFYACTIYMLSVSNFFFMYGIKFILIIIKNEHLEEFHGNNRSMNTKINTNNFNSGDVSKSVNDCLSTNTNRSDNTRNTFQTKESNMSSSENSNNNNNNNNITNYLLRLHYTETYN